MRRLLTVSLFWALLLLGSEAFAQPTDLEVGEVSAPQLKWGSQPMGLEIRNNVDYPKFAVATIDLKFEGTYLNPKRRWKYNAIVPPGHPAALRWNLEIPVNFGLAFIEVTVYDVIDTLDAVALGQKIMTQTFQLRFRIPEQVSPYMQERITFPPMVENNPLLDNEFTRVLLTMLNEGKTIPQISELAQVDTTFVQGAVNDLVSRQYVIRRDKVATLRFPFLTVAQAEKIKPIAEKTSDQLVDRIKTNLASYRKVLDSMVTAGVMTDDSSDLLNRGAVLYKTYPVISALVLWADLGRKFVNDTAMLDIYRGTDPCNAYMPAYMYAVQGGDVFNGHHYFYCSDMTGGLDIRFGDPIPSIKCPDLYPYAAALQQNSDWNYTPNFTQELFLIDTAISQPAVRTLTVGTAPVLESSLASLKKALDAFGPTMFTAGSRLWFWNLTASRTLDKLIAAGVVARRGNGQFKMESLK